MQTRHEQRTSHVKSTLSPSISGSGGFEPDSPSWHQVNFKLAAMQEGKSRTKSGGFEF